MSSYQISKTGSGQNRFVTIVPLPIIRQVALIAITTVQTQLLLGCCTLHAQTSTGQPISKKVRQEQQDSPRGTAQEQTKTKMISPEQFRKRALDLTIPQLSEGSPAAGKRVRWQIDRYRGTQVFHTLYLPADYQSHAKRKYPVIFEYAGNGPFKNKLGDQCSGKVEDCKMGYGISGGTDYIWVCLPFVSEDLKQNQRQWWGDVDATVEYCKLAVKQILEEYCGDKDKMLLCGFSRGSIACNYIGLRDDEIASYWCGMICHSHYDGVRRWHYKDSDKESAINRLKRLDGTPQWISHERTTQSTQDFLLATGIKGNFRFQDLPFANHSDRWLLQNTPERTALREWVKKTLSAKPLPDSVR